MESLKNKVSDLEQILMRTIFMQQETQIGFQRLQTEMKEFKDEMKELKDEMKEFKDEIRKDS